MPRYYFDTNANAPVLPEVQALVSTLMSESGNASAVHQFGQRTRHHIETARETIREAFGGKHQPVFTSSATEANNLFCYHTQNAPLLLSAVEHPSLLMPARHKSESGDAVETLRVDSTGRLDMAALEAALQKHANDNAPLWVSVQAANSETGVIQDLPAIADCVKRHRGFLHSDMVQLIGKADYNLTETIVDMVTLSGHKIGGILGAGALLCRDELFDDLRPQILGGAHEQRKRAGSENWPAIAAFAAAFSHQQQNLSRNAARMTEMRTQLEQGLQTAGAEIAARDSSRLANTVFAIHPHLEAQEIVMRLDVSGIAASSGSACASGKSSIGTTLQAMGIDPERAKSAVRFSFDAEISEQAIAYVIEQWHHL